mmetsp:Transcript_10250/g.20081  ORF Transcript_10250/g.20081 Transcript_10250/m.20081 type:complete len:345 (-) Transcript_10250:15-1049(-)
MDTSECESPRVLVSDVLAVSAQLALDAGAVIRDIHARGPAALGTVNKLASEEETSGVEEGAAKTTFGEDFDPQTAADREAELLLVRGLRKSFPGLQIVGEEHHSGLLESTPAKEDANATTSTVDFAQFLNGYAKDHEGDEKIELERVLVFVDPLDGTRSFINGALEYVTTLVGICVDGVPVAGIISMVFGGTMLLGGHCVGGVFHFDVEKPDGLEPVRGESKRKAVISSSRSEGVVAKLVKELVALDIIEPECVQASGAGYKFALVVTGEAGIYPFPRPGTCRWDSCAGTALVLARGGAVLDADGKPIIYDQTKSENDRGFVACQDQEVCKLICQHIANETKEA